MSREEPFLKRWSRLKTEQREEVKEGSSVIASKTEKTPASIDKEKEIQEKLIAELPPIDSLTIDSDYTGFMRKEVPEALRLQALRKLWASDPVLAGPDPLDFQNVDFTHLVSDELVQSSYQAGKGFVDEVADLVEGHTAEPEAPGPVATEADRAPTRTDTPPAAERAPETEEARSESDQAGDGQAAATGPASRSST